MRSANALAFKEFCNFVTFEAPPPSVVQSRVHSMEAADVDIIDFLEGPTPMKPAQSPSMAGASNVKVPPELPLKPKAKITIYVEVPSTSLYNKELKLLPTLTADQLIGKLQKKKILPESHTGVAVKWHMTHVPKKAPMETQELTSDGPRALWELGVRDQVKILATV